MTTSAATKAVVEQYVAAVEAGDAQRVRDSFAEEATWTLRGELPISGTWVGRDAIVDEFLAAAIGFYEAGSARFEVTSLTAEADRVAMEWTSRARTRAGAPYENFCIGVFTVRDGRIHAVREYMDTLYAQRTAFGASSAA